MTHTAEAVSETQPSPFAVGWQKLMMWIFIVGDGLLFAGFLASYGFARLAKPFWPDQSEIFSLAFISLMTFVLISSSATMASAVGAAQEGNSSAVVRYVALTALGGTIFLGMQVMEWTEFIHQGARLYANPWNVPQFSAFFFLITGFHGTHVLSGVLILLIAMVRQMKGKATPDGIELVGLYWHFVDLVWVFIFTFFYLL